MSDDVVDGLWYEVEGEGPVVVLLHAGIADSRMWNPQWEELSERYRVVRFDARGFGSSASIQREYAPHEDVVLLLDHLGIASAALVGVSMGAGVAIDTAISSPDRVSGVVAAGSGAQGSLEPDDEIRAGWKAIEEAYERGDLVLGNELDIRMWVDGPHRTPDEVDPRLRALAVEMNGRIWDRDEPGELVRRREPAAGTRLAELRCSVLAIAGALDQPYVVESGRLLAAGVADGRFEVLPGVAHLMNMEAPDAFTGLLLGFLSEA